MTADAVGINPDSNGMVFSGDQTDVALPVVNTLIQRGLSPALFFGVLWKQTPVLARLAFRVNPEAGYESILDRLLRTATGLCPAHGIPDISIFGGLNLPGDARRVSALAEKTCARAPRIGFVEDYDVRHLNPEGSPVAISHVKPG